MKVEEKSFGKLPDGKSAQLYTLTSDNGLVVKLTNYGGHITEIHLPDRHGRNESIILGFDNVEAYVKDVSYLGATVGRVANRIAGGTFELDGKRYTLTTNEKTTTLHGGVNNFSRRLWSADVVRAEAGSAGIRLRLFSPDGDEGFPGNLHAEVTYTVNDLNELRMDFVATTDKATPVNFTNHCYFNLSGAGSGDVLGHVLEIDADYRTPTNADLIPYGTIEPVKGKPFDFTRPMALGARMKDDPRQYDDNFVLNGTKGRPAATLSDPKSGRKLNLWTSQPALQVYTSLHLKGDTHGIGGTYHRYAAIALETQHFPDSVHWPNFPNTILRPGETYRHWAKYQFLAE